MKVSCTLLRGCLRDTICRGLPHLFAPIASTLTPAHIVSPMNGVTLERIAENKGHTEVLEYIRARRQQSRADEGGEPSQQSRKRSANKDGGGRAPQRSRVDEAGPAV